MKPLPILFITLLFLFSCKKDDEIALNEFSEAINFDVSEWVLKGENITCVDFDKDGNAWIASGSNLIFYDGLNTQSYSAGTVIQDVSVASDGRVWLGTKEKGLARFYKGEFTFYTSENAGLPRDYVNEVEVAPNGKVWFGSAAHNLGGLMCYDNGTFSLYTPENSILNQHVIQNLEVDRDSRVYFASMGTVGSAAVFRIDNQNNWKQLGGESSFYWISNLAINSKGEAFVAIDYSLSSYSGHENYMAFFDGKKWEKLEVDFYFSILPRMIVDKRDYIWVYGYGNVEGNNPGYFVFDGQNWHRSAKGQIPQVFIKSVQIDERNNIWFCSDEGIFILRQ
jgi:ligand-binding sensor domain-containing protein